MCGTCYFSERHSLILVSIVLPGETRFLCLLFLLVCCYIDIGGKDNYSCFNLYFLYTFPIQGRSMYKPCFHCTVESRSIQLAGASCMTTQNLPDRAQLDRGLLHAPRKAVRARLHYIEITPHPHFMFWLRPDRCTLLCFSNLGLLWIPLCF